MRAPVEAGEEPESECDDEPCPPAGSREAEYPPPFALALGLGLASFRGSSFRPKYTIDEGFTSREASADSPGLELLVYPTISLALEMRQPLLGFGTFELGLAERLSLASAPSVPGDAESSSLVGIGDVAIDVGSRRWPIGVALGGSMGMAGFEVDGIEYEAAFVLGVVGVLRFGLPGVPASLHVIVRTAQLLGEADEAGTYRDAQLAFALAL